MDLCDPGYHGIWSSGPIFILVIRNSGTMRKFLILPIIMSLVSACYWENEEALYSAPDFCDTLDVSYSEDVVPIMTNNCYACHSNANAPDNSFGNTFEDYEDVAASATSIVGAINHAAGYPAMPKGGEKLDTCSIATIEAWVNMGAPDN